MSWTQVDFSCVRYSPVEGTHYFFDPAYPTSVQFLLSGRWEPWDVGWVRYKAQDPDIRRVAEEAETRLVQDPNSRYTPWPEPPPPGPPPAPVNGIGNAPPQTNGGHANGDDAHTHLLSPEYDPAVDPALQLPQERGSTRVNLGPNIAYASPYGQQERQPPAGPSRQDAFTVPGAPSQAGPSNGTDRYNHNGPVPPPAQNHVQPSPGPPLQPAASVDSIVSRARETKILLSIDGDGIRGLSALLIIETLVNAICAKVGQRLEAYQIFDLTGGSSLGGVIAILLCRLRMQAHRAREAYKQIAKQVFANKKDFFVSLDPQASRMNPNGEALEEEIKSIVKQELGTEDELLLDSREDTGDVFIITTHIEIGSNKPAVLRSYQTRRITGPDLSSTPLPLTTALLSTVLAPHYTPPRPGITTRNVIAPGLVDHGTAKNNPVRDILYECRKLFRYANDMMIIVSIGSGMGIDRDKEIAEMANAVQERSAEAHALRDKFEAENRALIERGWMRYFRFEVEGLEQVALDESGCEERVREVTARYLERGDVGERFCACVDAISGLLLLG
ncbi:FabD/lysophospholipase-like protein, partial [Plenodomus tracheiphilus IPT5]